MMTNGFFSGIFLKLATEYWYFTVTFLILKFILLRFISALSSGKAFIIWLTGTLTFFCIACLCGFLFSSAGVYIVPFLMFIFALAIETVLCSSVFTVRIKTIFVPLLIPDGLLFLFLFGLLL